AHPSAHNVADIGTGSGAIAVSIAVNVANAKILATDISPKALHIAKENALKNKVEKQIDFVECDLLPRPQFKSQRSDLQPATFDVICANLPYIPTNTLYNLEIYQKEPTLALDGGADGLEIYRKLFSILPPYLAPKHLILCEIEASQGASAARLAERFFPNARINVHPDLAGHDRLLEIDNEN
ncbi:MAG: HemK family protein methyltransferase, partial [Anaerolineales bacterium]|nr:HemK family protein methyltransferase [Anaerolineales bacterium]